jgi:hypothetical protein
MKSGAFCAAVILTIVVTVSLFTNATFLATAAPTSRLMVSLGAGLLATLCASGAVALFASGYFFLKMANSPHPGKTILDARLFEGKSIFSNDYLSDAGKAARSRLLKSLAWFFGCWIGGMALGVAMQISLHGFG